MEVVFAYIAMCAILGYAGRKTKIGFWGWALISFFFSPIVALLILLLVGYERKHSTNNPEAS